MTSYADPNIEGWYSSHGLPWSGETATKLSELGVECVDDLKYLDQDAVDSLFKDEKPVVKGKVKVAWKKLEDDDEPPLVTAIRDVESQDELPGETKVPKLSIPAGISIALSVLGLIFGIVTCVKGDQAYDCLYNSYYYYGGGGYYDEYGNWISYNNSSGCDRDAARKAREIARGMGLTSFILFALATPLAFWVGRTYLPSKTREAVQTNRACANPRCCPFNMALYAWIFFLGAFAWGLAFCIMFWGGQDPSYYSSMNGSLYASVLVPNFVAWSLMFGYAEMVRKYKEDISLCC